MPSTHDMTLVRERLRRQQLVKPAFSEAAALVAWMGAVQAQEYEPARWGLGVRLAGAPIADDIEGEMSRGRIVRTHALRPTWHFVAARDLAWIQALTGPNVQRRMAAYNRQLELDSATLTRALTVVERLLTDEHTLTRAEIGSHLGRMGIIAAGPRLAHIAMHAELEGLICSGARRDRTPTYSLAAERMPRTRKRSRDGALGELTRRFFQSHGPATIRDFVWWSGLSTADARRGVDIVRGMAIDAGGLRYWTLDDADESSARGRRRAVKTTAHLLPIYDEYLVAYRDRIVVPHGPTTIPVSGRPVLFQHAVVVNGQVAGTWRTAPPGRGSGVSLVPMRRLGPDERDAIDRAGEGYRRFCAGR